MLKLEYFFYFILLILFIGFFGLFVLRSNLIITLISLEVLLFVVSIQFAIFSNILDDALGQMYSLLILSVAATESSVGLALLVAMFRLRGVISIDNLNTLKG